MVAARLIFIPGMGADYRLFGPQAAAGLRFEVPPFPIPAPGDTLPTYAARMAKHIDSAVPLIIGGVSFGGMVACELARICRPLAVILIASCRTGAAVPAYNRPVELIARLLPDWIIQRRAGTSSRMLARLESLTPEQAGLIRDMSAGVPVPFLRGAARMILRWKGPAGPLPCPVHQIHGQKDRIIPLKHVQPDEVVSGGGHLINLTHAEQVNAFIRSRLNQHCSCGSEGKQVRTQRRR